MDELTIGKECTILFRVEEPQTALAMGSGTLPVLATPAVAAGMEQAACQLLQPYLEEGITTVGTMLSLSHVSASPVGADISAKAVLTGMDGRKYSFALAAYDNAGLIAEGKHERFAVKADSFVRKTENKLKGR